jgi:acyl-CoA thioesterase-2
VVAIQHGRPIYSMSASFHRVEPGFHHQGHMPPVPPPDQLPTHTAIPAEVIAKMPETVRRYFERERPIELVPADFNRYLGKKYEDGRFNIWIRANERLPDDPAIHRCVLAYASDMMLLDTALVPHGRTLFEPEIMAASLDHALWFHGRTFRADEWMLYAQDTPSASGARGFARGQIFTADGTLVASVAQEGLVRERRAPTGG